MSELKRQFLVLCSQFSVIAFFRRMWGHERSSTSEENLCDFERAAAFVSFGVAVSEIYLGSGFLVFARGHSSGKLGRIARAGGGELVGNGAGSDSVA